MIEKDTIRLLRECDAGAKMGVTSINDSLDHAKDPGLRAILEVSRADHDRLSGELRKLLDRYCDEGKDPPAMAELMSRLKAGFRLAGKEPDKAVADFVIDGCNMGVKSLSKYLDEYAAADEKSKDICKRLISLEDRLSHDLRGYL